MGNWTVGNFFCFCFPSVYNSWGSLRSSHFHFLYIEFSKRNKTCEKRSKKLQEIPLAPSSWWQSCTLYVILGLNFSFLASNLLISYITKLKIKETKVWTKNKIEPQNIYKNDDTGLWLCYIYINIILFCLNSLYLKNYCE